MSRIRRDHDRYNVMDEQTDTENDMFLDNSELIVTSRSINRQTSYISHQIQLYQQRSPFLMVGGVLVFFILFLLASQQLAPIGTSITAPLLSAGRNIRKGDTMDDLMIEPILNVRKDDLEYSTQLATQENKAPEQAPQSSINTQPVLNAEDMFRYTHYIDPSQLEEEMIRGKSRLCSWWKSNQHSILQQVHQIVGDVQNHVLSLNFEFSSDRKNYVMQLERARLTQLNKPKMLDSPNCERQCHKDQAYFVKNGLRASDKGKEDVLIRTSLQTEFRQAFIECITCQAATIEINMDCDIENDTPFNNPNIYTSENHNKVYKHVPASTLLKHTLQNIFDNEHASPFFFNQILHDTLDVSMMQFDVALYNTDVSRKLFPLPSSKVEVPIATATKYTNSVLQNMQQLARLFEKDMPPLPKSIHGDLETSSVSGSGGVIHTQQSCSHPNHTSTLLLSSGGGGGKSLENNLEVCINDEQNVQSLTPVVNEKSHFQNIKYIAKNKKEHAEKTYNQPGKESRVLRNGQRRAHFDTASGGGIQWRSAQSKLFDDVKHDYVQIPKPSKLPLQGAYSQGMYDVQLSGGGGGSLDLLNNMYKETHGSEAIPYHRPATSVNSLKKQTLRTLVECIVEGGQLVLSGGGALSYESKQQVIHHQQQHNHTLIDLKPKVSSGFSFRLNIDADLLDDHPVSSLFQKNKANNNPDTKKQIVKSSEQFEEHQTSPDYDINLPSPDLDSIHFANDNAIKPEPVLLQSVMQTCMAGCMANIAEYHQSLRHDDKLRHFTLPSNIHDNVGYNHYHYEPTVLNSHKSNYMNILNARKRHSVLGKLNNLNSNGITSSNTKNTQELFYAQCICPCIQRNLKYKQWISYLGCNNLAIGTLDRSSTGHVDIDTTKTTGSYRDIKAPRYENRVHQGNGKVLNVPYAFEDHRN